MGHTGTVPGHARGRSTGRPRAPPPPCLPSAHAHPSSGCRCRLCWGCRPGGRGPLGGRGQRLIVRSVARRRWPPGPGLEVGTAAATASTAAASSSAAAAALQPTRCLGSALLSQNGCRCRGRGNLSRSRAGGREEDHRAAGHRPQVRAEAPQLGHQRSQDGPSLPAEAGEARTLCARQHRPRRLAAALPRSGPTRWRLCVPGARGPQSPPRAWPSSSLASRRRSRPPVSPGTSSLGRLRGLPRVVLQTRAALGTSACGLCAARASLRLRGDG